MKIEGFVPINKTAALVVGKGIEYTPNKKIQTVHSENPLPLKRAAKGQKDLTGITFGSLTVMGCYAIGKGLYSCRCRCGRFTARKAKSINNPANNEDCCEECRQLKFLKRRDAQQFTSISSKPEATHEQ